VSETTSKGMGYVAQAAFWFSLMSLLVKYAGDRIPSLEIVLVRAVVTLVMSWFLIRRAGIVPWGRRKGLLLLRGFLGFLALTCFYYSVVHIPLADATVIHYTNPVYTALLAAWFLGERLQTRTVVCAAVSLAGVVFIARPAFLFGGLGAVPIEPIYLAAAIAAAVFSAGAYVTVRKLGKSEDPLVVVFYFPLVTLPLVLPLVVPQWVWPTPLEWLALVGVGVTTQIAQVNLTRGLTLEKAGKAMTAGYLQIVFAAVWGALFFSEWPDALGIAGAVVVVGSTLVLARSGLGKRAERG
jgi:drug/metabolite transporter (DMT)-like permease